MLFLCHCNTFISDKFSKEMHIEPATELHQMLDLLSSEKKRGGGSRILENWDGEKTTVEVGS